MARFVEVSVSAHNIILGVTGVGLAEVSVPSWWRSVVVLSSSSWCVAVGYDPNLCRKEDTLSQCVDIVVRSTIFYQRPTKESI